MTHQKANIGAAPAIARAGTFRSMQPVPPVVEAAFWLVIAAAALSGMGLILVAAGTDWNAARDVGVLATTVGGGAVAILIRIGVAVMLRRGYSPARGYLTVVTVFSLGFAIVRGLDVVGALLVAMVVAAVVLVWLRPASRYYRAVTTERKRFQANGGKIGFLG